MRGTDIAPRCQGEGILQQKLPRCLGEGILQQKPQRSQKKGIPQQNHQQYHQISKGKIKALLILLITTIWTLTCPAQQTFEWAEKAGGNNTDVVNDIVCINNDIYLAGCFSGAITSDSKTATGIGSNDAFLLHYTKKGKTKWLSTLSGEGTNNATCLAVVDDKIFMGGTVTDDVEQDKQTFSGEGKAVFVSAWTDKGKIEWLTRLEYTGYASLDALCPLADGSLLIGGFLQGTMNIAGTELSYTTTKRAWTAVVSSDGTASTGKISSGSGDHRLMSAAIDDDDNYYLLFSITGNFYMNDEKVSELPDDSEKALVLLKQNSGGENQWAKTIASTSFLEGVKVICTNDENILAGVNFNKTLTTSDTTLTCKSLLQSAVICYDNDGEEQWAKSITSPLKIRIMDLALTGNNDILLTGYFRSSYSFDNEEITSDNSRGNLFLLQMDTKQNLVWHDEPAEDATNFCKVFTTDQTGNIILAGGFRDEIDIQDTKLQSSGKEDVLVAKYYNCDQKQAEIDGEEFLCNGQEISLTVSGSYDSYVWNESDYTEDNTYTVSEPGIYTVIAYDGKGCSAVDTIEIELAEEVDLGLPESIKLGYGERQTLLAEPGFESYLWSDGTEGDEYEVKYIASLDTLELSLKATTYDGCTATDTVMVYFNHSDKGTGKNAEVQRINVFPNPVEKELTWSILLSEKHDVDIALTNALGATLTRYSVENYEPGEQQTINMSTLPAGNYILNITVGDKVYSEKVIK